jgi:putative OPT family oligopeptide transporter
MNANDAAQSQLTVRAIVLSLILAVVLAAANAYLGLFAGLTVATAIPAAVVSMGVLRLMGRSSILENNIVATGASAASSIAAGTIFTIPALVIMGHWSRFDYWWVLAIAGLGGLLGVLFSVPLRRTLIIDQNLQFPEGVATAEVLKVGQDPGSGLKILSIAAAAGALFKLALSGFRFSPENFTVARFFGERTIGYFGINLSPALLGVGFIVGFNIGCLMLSGGALAYWVFIPLYNNFMIDQNPALAAQLVGLSAADAAAAIRGAEVRFIGVGAMLIGGLWSLWALRKSLLSGVRTGLAMKATSTAGVPHTEQDMPMKVVVFGIVLFVLPIFALYQAVVGNLGIAFAMAVVMVIAGFVFSAVSGYMAGLVGSSNNPVSGITISTILFASLLLLAAFGKGSTVGPVAAIMIGAVICSAAAVAGDNLQDLKAGQLVGATPWRQQVMLGVGAIASAAIMAPVLNLLLEAYGIGTAARPGVNPLQAPQAVLMASVASGIFGAGLPWNMVGIGAVVGAIVIALDEYLKRKGASWRTPVLGVAIGIYLPLELTTPIFVGGLIAELATRWHRRRNPGGDPEKLKQMGLLFSAGLIAGEAIVGVLIAIPIVATGDAEVLSLVDEIQPWQQFAGVAALALMGWWMYRVSTQRGKG